MRRLLRDFARTVGGRLAARRHVAAGCQPAVLLAVLVLLAGALPGCGPEVVNEEIKALDEPLVEEELRAFLSIVHTLPGRKLPPLPAAVLEMPAWSRQRTLPVKELLVEQRKRIEDRRSIEAIVRHLKPMRGIDRALRKEAWSIKRFASYVLVLAAALNRSSISDAETLTQILEDSEAPLHTLSGDSSVLAGMSDEAAYGVLDKARWIPLRQHALWLSRVPPETLELVKQRRADLEAVFPADWRENPFAPWEHILKNDGTPFEERPASGTDASIPL
jgi:hypothetical protein